MMMPSDDDRHRGKERIQGRDFPMGKSLAPISLIVIMIYLDTISYVHCEAIDWDSLPQYCENNWYPKEERDLLSTKDAGTILGDEYNIPIHVGVQLPSGTSVISGPAIENSSSCYASNPRNQDDSSSPSEEEEDYDDDDNGVDQHNDNDQTGILDLIVEKAAINADRNGTNGTVVRVVVMAGMRSCPVFMGWSPETANATYTDELTLMREIAGPGSGVVFFHVYTLEPHPLAPCPAPNRNVTNVKLPISVQAHSSLTDRIGNAQYTSFYILENEYCKLDADGSAFIIDSYPSNAFALTWTGSSRGALLLDVDTATNTTRLVYAQQTFNSVEMREYLLAS